MRYLVKNISTDKILYPAAINGNMCSMLRPGDTIPVDAKGKDELEISYPEYIQILGTYLDPHASVTINKTIGAGWEFVDLGYYYGTINIKADASTVTYSLSGFTAPNTAPPVDTQGVLTVGEDITLFITTKPERYMYVKGPGDIQITGS